MKKIAFAFFISASVFSISSAQRVTLFFGPIIDGYQGMVLADTNEVIDLDIWIHSDMDLGLEGLEISLSTKDEYIQNDSRDGGQFCDIIQGWEDATFSDSEPDPENDGYTNQAIRATCSVNGD